MNIAYYNCEQVVCVIVIVVFGEQILMADGILSAMCRTIFSEQVLCRVCVCDDVSS